MIITLIIVSVHMIAISSQSISSQMWSDMVKDLSSKINYEKIGENAIESYPLVEGFMTLPNNREQSSLKMPKTTDLSFTNGSTILSSISSTTCRTKTTEQSSNHLKSSNVDRESHRIRKQLSSEPIINNNIQTHLKLAQTEDVDAAASASADFLIADNDELSKQIINSATTVDGSGDTTEETTEQTSSTTVTSSEPITSPSTTISSTTSTTTLTVTMTPPKELINIANNTIFILEIPCENATLNNIVNYINQSLNGAYSFTASLSTNDSDCTNSTKLNITLDFYTGTNITFTNNLIDLLHNITKPLDFLLYSYNKCGNNETELVKNVTSCFFINLCNLCGVYPPRGVCFPEDGISACRCFFNPDDPSNPYVGERCLPPDPKPIKPVYIPPTWTPVIIGTVAGLAGLFVAMTCCLWALFVWRRRRSRSGEELSIFRLWHLPRAKVPKSGTIEQTQSSKIGTMSVISNSQSNFDFDKFDTADSTFFKELDKKMSENLRATITRPDTSGILAGLPVDTRSITSNDDPINDLDAVIDDEDQGLTFHDSLDDLYDHNEDFIESINPNLQLSEPHVYSQPKAIF